MAQSKFTPETLEQRRARLQQAVGEASAARSTALDNLIGAHGEFCEADRVACEARQALQDLEAAVVAEGLRGLDRLRLTAR